MKWAWGRILGALWLAGLVFWLVHFAWGIPVASAGAVLLGGGALRFFPSAVLRRLAFAVPSFVLLIYCTTALMYCAPGSPFARERVATPQVEAALRAQYGVPERASEFFAVYMGRLIGEGSLGPSIKVQGRSVEDLLLPALPVSLSLGLSALGLAIAFGMLLGVCAGLRPHSTADIGSMGLAMLGISLPNFVVGALLILLFALTWNWLPVAGWGSYRHLVLPALTLALPYTAIIARLSRSSTLEVMHEDFVRTARAKGLPERVVVLKHILKNASLSTVSFLGPAAAGILTGSFVVETLFGIPGMGQWFVKGAINRDYSVVLGTSLFYFGFIAFFNLLADLALAWLDPRIRESR